MTAPNPRPTCPICGVPVDRLRRSLGVFAAYPCNDWLTPEQAVILRDQAHAARP